MALSTKKIQFCYEYLVDFNITKAMIRTGSTPKGASSTGSIWMENPEIKAKIAELRHERALQSNLQAVDVLKELAVIVKSDIKDFIEDDNTIKKIKTLPSEKTRAISSIVVQERYNLFGEKEITTKLTFWDKNSALEKLGRHFGVFEVDNNQKRPLIQVNIQD